jgi:nucleoside-diphosphate-sugar epimerase
VRGGEVNVVGSLRLFELLRNRSEPIQGLAYASSYAVHGPTGGTSRSPETFYGAFKRSVELIAEQYSRHFGLHSVGLRPFVVYGAGREQGISAAPSLAARAAALGENYTFSFSGSAGLVYVEDVAAAFVRSALETPPGSHLIDMPGDAVTMEQVVEVLGRLCPDMRGKLSISGPPLPATREEHPVLMSSLYPDWQKTPLEEGLRRTVEGWAELECC